MGGIEGEVKAWINSSAEGLGRWLEKKPDWFTDHVKSSITDDLVEDEGLLKLLRHK